MAPEPVVPLCSLCKHKLFSHNEFADGTFGSCWLCDCPGPRKPKTDRDPTRNTKFDDSDVDGDE